MKALFAWISTITAVLALGISALQLFIDYSGSRINMARDGHRFLEDSSVRISGTTAFACESSCISSVRCEAWNFQPVEAKGDQPNTCWLFHDHDDGKEEVEPMNKGGIIKRLSW